MGMSASQARMLSLTARMSDLELSAQQISNAKIRLADQSAQASRVYSEALDKQTLTVFSGLQSDGSSSYIEATANNLTSYNATAANSLAGKQKFIKDASGAVLTTTAMQTAFTSATDVNSFLKSSSVLGYSDEASAKTAGKTYDAAAVTYYTNVYNEMKECGTKAPGDSNMNNSDWLQANINAGNVYLAENNQDAGTDGKGDVVNISWTSGDASLHEKSNTTGTAKAEADYETTMASIQSKDKKFDLQLVQINTEHSAIQTEIDSVKKVIDKNIERSFKTFG